jgi:CO/xanthine dehydrogenase FAD-binding subunit
MPALLPGSFVEACAFLADDPERIALAGGTDLVVAWPQRFDRQDATYVDLSKLAELKTITWTEDALVLGAGTTYWDVLRDARVTDAFPLLAEAARRVGALQIQTRGTWAGNIVNASPSADGAAVLMAIGAVVELVSADAEESVPLADFYLGYNRMRRRPDQLIRAIRIPRREYSVQFFEKVGARAAQTLSNLSVALARSAAGWRVVAGGMAPNVACCARLEQLIESEMPIDSPEAFLPAIRADLSPVDDVHASAAYRERVLARVVFTKLSEVCPWIRGCL